MAAQFCETLLIEPSMNSVKVERHIIEDSSQSSLALHNGGAPQFACVLCDGFERTKADLQRHLVEIHGLPPSNFMACRQCNAYFADRDTRDAHEESAHRFECVICIVTFGDKAEFEKHIYEQHMKSPNRKDAVTHEDLDGDADGEDEEDDDEEGQNGAGEAEIHSYLSGIMKDDAKRSILEGMLPEISESIEKRKRAKRSFRCVKCKGSFQSSRELRRHENDKHPIDVTPVLRKSPRKSGKKGKKRGRKPGSVKTAKVKERSDPDNYDESSTADGSGMKLVQFYCPHCEVVYASKRDLLDLHLMEEVHEGEMTTVCQFCREIYPSRVELREHIEFKHLDPDMILSALVQEAVNEAEKRLANGDYLCTHCNVPFMNKTKYTEHTLHEAHTAEDVECKLCTAKFTANPALAFHILKVHTVPKGRYFLCKFCGLACGHMGRIQSHLVRHLNIRKFACQHCSKTFCDKFTLQNHQRDTHQTKEVYPCPMCDRICSSYRRLREHMRMVHEGVRYSCPYCSKKFCTQTKMKAHVRKGHPEEKQISNSDDEKAPTVCSICNVLFRSNDTLQRHLETVHRPTYLAVSEFRRKKVNLKRHLCSECGANFGRKEGLQYHLAKHHGYEVKGNLFIQCDVCAAKVYRHGMAYHMLKHSNERKYQCELCGASFKHQPGLYYHRKAAHSAGPEYQCEICSKQFRTKAVFDKHMNLSHATFDNPQKCPICQKEFRTIQHVRNHVNNSHHRKYRNYECPYCHKRFSKCKLAKHIVIHTGEKDFVCPYCPKACNQKDNLRGHIRRCHPDLPLTI